MNERSIDLDENEEKNYSGVQRQGEKKAQNLDGLKQADQVVTQPRYQKKKQVDAP